MLKKVLKITGISLLVIIIALAAAPFLFKDKIKAMVTKTLNENVNANKAVGYTVFISQVLNINLCE